MSETIGSFNDTALPAPTSEEVEFADLLRAAVSARGLGLERIKARLDERGTPVSVATLSYWCSGRSQPERKGSLAALPHLEAILELPDGALRATVAAPRRRGRRRQLASLETVWPETAATRVLGGLDTRWDSELERVSVHDLITVGSDRTERSMLVREVVRARCDGPDRRVVLHGTDDPEAAQVSIVAQDGCRRGRTLSDPHGIVGAELEFHQPLRRGETAVLSYLMRTEPPRPRDTAYARRFRVPTREYLLQVWFHPSALPHHCETIVDGTPQPLCLDPDHSVHTVDVDCTPGPHGIRWTWPTATTRTR